MFRATDRYNQLDWLEGVLLDNKETIFEHSDNGFRIVRLSVTTPLYRRGDRYHQIVKASYKTSGRVYQKQLWLKYRPDFESLYRIQKLVSSQMPDENRFFPKVYFYKDLDETSVIGMEYVKGVPLRNLLLRRVASGRTASLNEIFVNMGQGMRAFHNSSKPTGALRVSEVAQSARSATAQTSYLTAPERERVLEHVRTAEATARPHTELSLIKIHNDWVLRNILVSDGSSFHIVDLDSMRAPHNSRWYDVTYFLINLESQLKYWPIIRKSSITYLWKSFWRGYSANESPDSLSTQQITALIYLIKVQYLLGATIRPPLSRIYNNAFGPLYLRQLKESMLRGHYSTLAIDL